MKEGIIEGEGMIKAVFLDYTGTMVREDGDYTKLLIKFFMENSDVNDPVKVVKDVWKLVKQYEESSYLDSFVTENGIVEKIIDYYVSNHGLKGDFEYLKKTWEKSWIYAPLFDDVKNFFDNCPVPIYIMTNDGKKYLEMSMEDKGLNPAGIISAEDVRAFKPHKEIFEEALRVSGVSKEEAVVIGDSIVSDVNGAKGCGIKAILLDRKGDAVCEDATVVKSLKEALRIIK